MQNNKQHRAVEAARTRILRGDLPPVADADLAEALEILERHGRPTGVNVRLPDGRTQAGDLVLATATLPPILRARGLARWHARESRLCGRQARRGSSSRKAHLRRFAVAHSRAAARLSGARPRGCDRQARPRARRTAASSSTSSSDPPPPPPRLTLWRHPRFGSASPNLLRLLVRAQAEEMGS